MELTESRKETSTLTHYKACSVEVPVNYSRQKALNYTADHSDVRGGRVNAIPQKDARQQLYLMLMKIGATGELPQDEMLRVSFLNDFWSTLYLRNDICPGDIPFGIILSEFTTALVQGVADRKGNNQAAICQAFNNWVKREDVRNRLYLLRDRAYPDQKPKQVPEKATQASIRDCTDEDLSNKLKSIKPMAGIKMVDKMICELESEINRRIEKINKNGK